MENTQQPKVFAFTARGQRYTCISVAVLERLNNLGIGISIANEVLPDWGYSAEDIKEYLSTLGVDPKQYRYRNEAPLNTRQLQALVNFYLSLKDLNPADEIARFI